MKIIENLSRAMVNEGFIRQKIGGGGEGKWRENLNTSISNRFHAQDHLSAKTCFLWYRSLRQSDAGGKDSWFLPFLIEVTTKNLEASYKVVDEHDF